MIAITSETKTSTMALGPLTGSMLAFLTNVISGAGGIEVADGATTVKAVVVLVVRAEVFVIEAERVIIVVMSGRLEKEVTVVRAVDVAINIVGANVVVTVWMRVFFFCCGNCFN